VICQIARWRELDRWIPGSADKWEAIHPLAALEDLLLPRCERVNVEGTLGEWQAITIHFNGSVVPRDREAPFTGLMFAAYPGDLVFSKIDARNGAIGLVPDSIPKAIVTSEYPIHQPDLKQVDSQYLALLLRTPNFLSLIRRHTSSTSGRKRITPEAFREIQVPIPELDEQQRMVTVYDRALARSAKLEAQANSIEREAQLKFEAALGLTPPPDLPKRPFQIARFRDIERWSHEGVLQRAILGATPPESKFEIVELGDIAIVSYGLQKCPANRPGKHARPYLRVANVQRGYLDLREIKTIDVPDSDMPAYRLDRGDVLFVEGNGSLKELGRVAVWQSQIENCVHQNHIIKARLDQEKAVPEFIMEWFNTEAGRMHFFRNAKTTSGLGTINSTEVRKAPVPLPDDLKVQEAIVRSLRDARAKATRTRDSASNIRTAAWNEFITGIFT
jgi:type I restriction enzyme S subunit